MVHVTILWDIMIGEEQGWVGGPSDYSQHKEMVSLVVDSPRLCFTILTKTLTNIIWYKNVFVKIIPISLKVVTHTLCRSWQYYQERRHPDVLHDTTSTVRAMTHCSFPQHILCINMFKSCDLLHPLFWQTANLHKYYK